MSPLGRMATATDSARHERANLSAARLHRPQRTRCPAERSRRTRSGPSSERDTVEATPRRNKELRSGVRRRSRREADSNHSPRVAGVRTRLGAIRPVVASRPPGTRRARLYGPRQACVGPQRKVGAWASPSDRSSDQPAAHRSFDGVPKPAFGAFPSRRRSYQCQAPLRGSGVKTADKTFMSHSSEEGMLL